MATKKPTPKPTVKAPVKKKVLVMPDTINPFKMTPELKFIIPIVQKLDRE